MGLRTIPAHELDAFADDGFRIEEFGEFVLRGCSNGSFLDYFSPGSW